MSKSLPQLSLCMIVKNEENNLAHCLESVKAAVDEIIIVDTGSTDQTVQLAKKYASLIVQVPWNDNFAEARNTALEEATGKWILVMDADEILYHEDIDRLKILLQNELEYEGFFLTIINRKYSFLEEYEERFPSLRLFRNRPLYRFNGAIHEQIAPSIPYEKLTASKIRIIHQGHNDLAKNKKRSKRNIDILEKVLNKDPENEFQRFNLGIEYMVLGQYKQGLEQFKYIQEQKINRPMWLSKYYKSLAYCYLKEEQWESAKASIQKGINKFPGFPDLYYLQGMLLIAQKKYKEALFPLYTCLSIGEAINPEYISEAGMGTFKIYFILGSIYEHLGERKKAKLFYLNALQFKLNHIAAGKKLISLLLEEQEPEQVIDFLNIIYDNTNAKHLLLLAKMFFDAKQYKLCYNFANRALRVGADSDPVYYLLGLCSYRDGKFTNLKKYLSKIEDKKTYNLSYINLIISSLTELNEQLSNIHSQFPDSTFFTMEQARLNYIINQYILQ